MHVEPILRGENLDTIFFFFKESLIVLAYLDYDDGLRLTVSSCLSPLPGQSLPP